MDNFGLKVKATNVVGSGDGVEVYVHCDDHDIVFNASIPFDKSIIDSDSSLRSEDKGDDMSTLVGTVLSGFEYRAHKEKYDNLYKFFKENEKKYQYTGFTKEAINKTQNSGYENEYFYIVANIPTLQEYRKYYEPLIKKNNLNFKKGMKQARKGVGYKAAIEVHTTLFSRSSNFSKDKKLDDVLDLSESTKKLHLNFENTKIFLQLAKSTISTNRVNYSDNESIRIEVE
ncbi:PF07901 family protein [Staphylococcus aureus subsp. aureus IS-55]|nr:PF07901 family protein [Staphylococcus aureus subsp. aureus IS-55]SBC08292.1 lipoprotein [Staphylococcus aureus]SCU50952.1 lipoprotein [Staphylococcus aureus]